MSREKLKQFLADRGLQQQDLATDLGVSQGCVSDLVRGRRNPSGELAFRIESMTRGEVPARGWFE